MASKQRSRMAWIVLGVALTIELVGGVFLLIGMLPTFPEAGPDRDAFAPLWVSLVVSMVLAIVWVAVTLTGVVRSRARWVRSSAVTLHLLLAAAAVGVFQGILGTPSDGFVLLGLGIVGLVAAIIARSTAQPGEGEVAGSGPGDSPTTA